MRDYILAGIWVAAFAAALAAATQCWVEGNWTAAAIAAVIFGGLTYYIETR